MIRWTESTPCLEAECPVKPSTDTLSSPGTLTRYPYADTLQLLSPGQPVKIVVLEIILTTTMAGTEYPVRFYYCM